MRYSFSLLLAAGLILLLISSVDRFNQPVNIESDAINAVLGDRSYISLMGTAPDSSVPDAKRIEIHLTYVEALLREGTNKNMDSGLMETRLYLLDHLRAYRMAGNFPVNDDHTDHRRPTFISDNGNICAVGYLVEQSAGRDVAGRINDAFKYSYITEIDDPVFLEWVDQSGFTIQELAMIQPAYQGGIVEVRQNTNRLGTTYVLGSGVALTANALYWAQPSTGSALFQQPEVRQWTGLAVGAGTMLLGGLNVNATTRFTRHEQHGMWSNQVNYIETNHLKSAVSIGHMLVGAATVFRSAWGLLYDAPQSEHADSGLMVTSFELPNAHGTQVISGVGYRFALN